MIMKICDGFTYTEGLEQYAFTIEEEIMSIYKIRDYSITKRFLLVKKTTIKYYKYLIKSFSKLHLP